MKQGKRLLALLLVIVMIFAMSACGEDKSAISGSVTENAEETDDGIEAGSIEGGTYENTYLGIGCALDSDWTYSSEEELAQMNEISSEAFTDEELKEVVKDADVFYDMYAVSSDGLAMLQVVFENLGIVYGTVLDEEGYVEACMGSLDDAFADLGAEDVQIDTSTMNFCGEDHHVIRASFVVNDVAVYQTMVTVKAGNHMAILSAISYFEDITDTLLDFFYEIS